MAVRDRDPDVPVTVTLLLPAAENVQLRDVEPDVLVPVRVTLT